MKAFGTVLVYAIYLMLLGKTSHTPYYRGLESQTKSQMVSGHYPLRMKWDRCHHSTAFSAPLGKTSLFGEMIEDGLKIVVSPLFLLREGLSSQKHCT